MTTPVRAAVLLAAIAVLAGCLGASLLEGSDASSPDPASDAPDGTMTAEAERSSSQDVETGVVGGPFVARRTVAIQGDLTLPELLVNLSVDRGRIDVATGPAGSWEAQVQVVGHGATPEEAAAERDEVTVNWSAGEPGDRGLRIATQQPEEDDQETGWAESSIEVTLPVDLATQLEVGAEDGNVTISDLKAPVAAVGVAEGGVDADLRGTQLVDIGVSNGGINATVRPGYDGQVVASVANGYVEVRVPEDDDHGYRARASTANGDAAIELEDGETTQGNADPNGDAVEFVTTGYEDRPTRTTVVASASNGEVLVAPT